MEQFISRRSALKKTLEASLGIVGVSAISQLILSSCQSCKNNNQHESHEALSANFSDSCALDTNLSDEDHVRRNTLKYVDQTPISTRTCDNCKLYTNATAGSFCGGCKVLPGPIHPKGYCNSWYRQM